MKRGTRVECLTIDGRLSGTYKQPSSNGYVYVMIDGEDEPRRLKAKNVNAAPIRPLRRYEDIFGEDD